MKRWSSIFLFMVLSIQFVGFYAYYAYRLTEIRKEVRSQLRFMPEESLQRFTFSKNAFNKIKQGDDEILLEEKMYDIARLEIKNDSVIVFALHDEAEDNLLVLLHTMVRRTSTDRKQVPAAVTQLLTLHYIQSSFNWEVLKPMSSLACTPYVLANSVVVHDTASPPPKI